MQLKDKHIILGITGSIAAYKAAALCRLLVKHGATVKVVMTPLATQFITPVTMATLSQNSILVDFFKHDDGTWNNHVELGLWADIMLVAPATANTIAKFANGVCDNLLLTTYLSVRCPVMIAPAMDMDMYKHPATTQNIEKLKTFGNIIIEPQEGELASTLVGKGRMAEPEQIVANVVAFFEKKKFKNKKVLITAGPTLEPIDAVRYIGNHSTGKMGTAIATEFIKQGALVTLILGPTPTKPKIPNCNIIDVTTAQEMFEAAAKEFSQSDIIVLAAAVADFTPAQTSEKKIKRTDKNLIIKLNPTVDIAAHLGQIKRDDQILVGFALETDNELENARIKMRKKNLDMIILNSLKDQGAGFGYDTNKVTILKKSGEIIDFPLKTKSDVACDIMNAIG